MQTTQTPHVAPEERLTVRPMGKDLYNAVLRYGFMDEPNVPEALALAAEQGLLPIERRRHLLPRAAKQ